MITENERVTRIVSAMSDEEKKVAVMEIPSRVLFDELFRRDEEKADTIERMKEVLAEGGSRKDETT